MLVLLLTTPRSSDPRPRHEGRNNSVVATTECTENENISEQWKNVPAQIKMCYVPRTCPCTALAARNVYPSLRSGVWYVPLTRRIQFRPVLGYVPTSTSTSSYSLASSGCERSCTARECCARTSPTTDSICNGSVFANVRVRVCTVVTSPSDPAKRRESMMMITSSLSIRILQTAGSAQTTTLCAFSFSAASPYRRRRHYKLSIPSHHLLGPHHRLQSANVPPSEVCLTLLHCCRVGYSYHAQNLRCFRFPPSPECAAQQLLQKIDDVHPTKTPQRPRLLSWQLWR